MPGLVSGAYSFDQNPLPLWPATVTVTHILSHADRVHLLQPRFHQQSLQLQCNQVPSNSEMSTLHVADWQHLEPTLISGSSPEIECVVNRLSEKYPLLHPRPAEETIMEILREVEANPVTLTSPPPTMSPA